MCHVFLAKFYFVEHIRFQRSRQGKSGISVLILQVPLHASTSVTLHAAPHASGAGVTQRQWPSMWLTAAERDPDEIRVTRAWAIRMSRQCRVSGAIVTAIQMEFSAPSYFLSPRSFLPSNESRLFSGCAPQ